MPTRLLSNLFTRTSGNAGSADIASSRIGSLPGSLPGEVHERLLTARYARWAQRYDRSLARYSAETLAVAIGLLEPLPRRILDLACGTGLLAQLLDVHLASREEVAAQATPADKADEQAIEVAIEMAVEMVGVDLSDAMLEQARARTLHRVRGRFLRGRADEIPLPSRSVPAIVLANAFHLIRDPFAALAECRRVLTPGGQLVIVDWCRDFVPMRALANLLNLTQRLERRVERLDRLSSRVQGAGFDVDAAFRFRVWPLWGMMAIRARLSGG